MNKQTLHNTVFALIEEELYNRLHPSTYRDQKYDGTNFSICGSSNLDILSLEQEENLQKGGGNLSTYVPGKFEAIKYSYKIPLNIAIQTSFERQKLFKNNIL